MLASDSRPSPPPSLNSFPTASHRLPPLPHRGGAAGSGPGVPRTARWVRAAEPVFRALREPSRAVALRVRGTCGAVLRIYPSEGIRVRRARVAVGLRLNRLLLEPGAEGRLTPLSGEIFVCSLAGKE